MNEKKQIFLIVGLLIVLIVVWALVLRSPTKKGLEQSIEQAEDGVEFKLIIDMADKYLNARENVQEFSYTEDRDPFSSKSKDISGEKVVVASKLFERLVLKGILWDRENPLALINEEVVGQGETIEGVRIKKIQPTSVIVEAEGEKRTLFIEGR